MKNIVVYHSNTGFTKKYAQWIGEELGCQVISDDEFYKGRETAADLIIYGGGIMAGKVNGLERLKKNAGSSRLVVFAVGAAPQNNNISADGETPFYYMEGGIAYGKMKFLTRKMLQMMSKSLEKKKNRTAEETGMMQALRDSFDHTNRENIRALVDDVRNIVHS